MNLNIKLVIIVALLGTVASHAQLFGKKTNHPEGRKLFSMQSGLITPFALGDNIVSNDATVKWGATVSGTVNVYDHLHAGLRFDIFGYALDDITFSGSYDRATSYASSVVAGYTFLNGDTWEAGVYASIGNITYANKRDEPDISFNENGSTFAVSIEGVYVVNKYVQLFISPRLRFDRLKIEAPAAVSDRLNKINYFSVNTGVRLTLWKIKNIYKTEEE